MDFKDIHKYIKDGLHIQGNETDGYHVFTIPTQHFKIKSLDELTLKKFDEMNKKQNRFRDLISEAFRNEL